MSISKKIVFANVLFALLLALALSFSGYQRFDSVIERRYTNTALRAARTALTFIDVENFSEYSRDTLARQKILHDWQEMVDTQELMFAYVIQPEDDYNNIRFVLDVENSTFAYEQIPLGSVKPTSSAEYKESYRDIYEHGKDLCCRSA